MKRTYLCLFLLLAAALLLTACGSEAPGNNSPSNASPSANNPAANNSGDNSNEVATKKGPEAPTTNDAPTISPVVAAYFNALKTKNDAALEKVLSAKYLATLRADMKDEGKTGIAEYLAEYEMGTGKPMEARNEKIDGDKAIAEVRGGGYLNWTPIIFVKENGSWKYSGDSPDIQRVKGN